MTRKGKPRFLHGMSQREFRTTYESWNQMMQRCTNPKSHAWDRYGGKGIRPCKFLAGGPGNVIILLGMKPTDRPSIDRFPNPEGGYWCGECEECLANGWPLNVRWANRTEQSRNRKDRVLLEAFGKAQLMVDWAAEYGLTMRTLWARLQLPEMTLEKALTMPLQRKSHGPGKGTSGFKGVSATSDGRYWRAQVKKNGKFVLSKTFPFTEEGKIAAARAVNLAYREHYPEAETPNPGV